MRDILVDHHAIQNLWFLDGAAGDFLHFGVALDVDLCPPILREGNCGDSVQCYVHRHVGPLSNELGADAALDHIGQGRLVVLVDGNTDGSLQEGHYVFESLFVLSDDDGGVELLFKELFGRREHLPRQDYDRCRSVTNL